MRCAGEVDEILRQVRVRGRANLEADGVADCLSRFRVRDDDAVRLVVLVDEARRPVGT